MKNAFHVFYVAFTLIIASVYTFKPDIISHQMFYHRKYLHTSTILHVKKSPICGLQIQNGMTDTQAIFPQTPRFE